ncbi:50S ribosomal protein L10 [Alkalibaculum sp. M08DMB]|uniref:Large ribosomal subunit protein uL10 n=1 Tax=Alkalibaculum sporogenes TaxID=2655001 RepID=A0A6A7K776_9FIRM|nr:50S ribosomal protein L10 [Alkalibaculum sporogenes]MPW25037.1 50S ribosomal protein L10 [Alkalibaculum sporogenes]
MSNQDAKKAIVSEIAEKFSKAQTAVLVDYRGLNVEEVTEFRAIARELNVDYKIYKNSMMRFAVKETGYEGLLENLVGPSAIAFGYDDPVATAKIITEFAKKHKAMEIKAGMVDGKVLDKQGVMALAELPSREVLIAQVLGGLNAPISGLVNVLQGNIRGLVIALNQIKEQKEATA